MKVSNKEFVPVDSLKPYPYSETIYGTTLDISNLIDSVCESGVHDPLLVTHDGAVISGNRRLMAAREVGLKQVPVRRVEGDDLELQQLCLDANRQREKTPEMKDREYIAYKAIEAEKAKKRMVQAAGKPLGEKSTPPTLAEQKGEARDKAAKLVGLGRTNAEKLAALVEWKDSGDPEACEVMDAVNRGDMSIHAAHKRWNDEISRLLSEFMAQGDGIINVTVDEEGELGFDRISCSS